MLQPASYDFVIAVSTHPRNWPWIVEDGIEPKDYAPVPNRLYLAHEDQGYVAVERVGRFTWAFHIAMLPKAKGVKEFVQRIMDALELIFDAKKFMASIPVDNRAANILARRIGAKLEGTITQTIFRNNKMQDVNIYGINK